MIENGKFLDISNLIHHTVNCFEHVSLHSNSAMGQFSSSAFSASSLGFTIFNPTMEVVTFCVHGWVHVGCVFVGAIHPSRIECQDLSSLCDGMHVCTD